MNRELLEKPFDPAQIKQREGRKGKVLDYIEGHAVIQRLNDAFDANWSFEILDREVLKESDEVLVLGKLTADGVIKMQFGMSKITRDKDNKEIISLGEDWKAAGTDALKKCATLLGVGLHLYAEKKAGEPPAAAPGKRLDHAQHAAILKLANQKGWSQVELNQEAVRRYNVQVPYLSASDAAHFIQVLQGRASS